MADFRAGSWTHPSGGFRAGVVAYSALGHALTGDAGASATATASLTADAGLSGSASGDASASGALVNWTPVTVASPDNGPGSIFDARWWTGAAPADGDLVWYENRDGFTVLPNGQYSASAYGLYLVQFAYASAPTVRYVSTVEIIETDFAAVAAAQASASGSLSGGAIELAGAATATSDATGTLSGVPGAALAGDASSQADATGALSGVSGAVDLIGSGSGEATAAGSLAAPQIGVYPFNRTIAWDDGKTPDLVIGDTFQHLVTLRSNGAPFDLSSASAIRVAVVSRDHGMALSDSIQVSSAYAGANWSSGEVIIYIGGMETAEIANHVAAEMLGKIEIEATIGVDQFTWFGVVRIVPGQIN